MEPRQTTPAQRRLTDGLRQLRTLQQAGRRVYQSADFTRLQREALETAGFLQRVVKGWYIASRPGQSTGDSTAWNASFADFVGGYCDARFGEQWCVAPRISLLLHTGASVLPRDMVVHAAAAGNHRLELPAGCSLYDARLANRLEDREHVRIGSLRALTLAETLVRLVESDFEHRPTDIQIALQQLPDASDLNRLLLEGSQPVVAGRLAGALRAAHRPVLADDVRDTMRAVGHTVVETNPFTQSLPVFGSGIIPSPYVPRLGLLWHAMRPAVEARVPTMSAGPVDVERVLEAVDEAYPADAYHSLSIEGYQVTEELIARVANNDWNPDDNPQDAESRNAMAARGYFLAHQAVRASLRRILSGEDAATVVDADHGGWYRQLFTPSVTAGLLKASDLAGYRNAPVYIKNAAHVPPPFSAAREMMPALFTLLAAEPHAAVRAVLGHFAFVFIHPYMDGNGRMARFLLNAMLVAGGFPWTIIPVARRDEYMAALDAASARDDIAPFAQFIVSCIGVPQAPQA